jgi:hypothetical protein
MPSVSEKQRRLMGADLARKRAGKRTRTDMTEAQLEDYARKPVSGPTTQDAARVLRQRTRR